MHVVSGDRLISQVRLTSAIFRMNKTFPCASVLRLCAFFFSFSLFVFFQCPVRYPSTPYTQVTLPVLRFGYSGRFIRPIVCRACRKRQQRRLKRRCGRCTETEGLFHTTEGVASRHGSPDVESGLVVSLSSDSLRMQACLRCTTRWRNLVVRIYRGSCLSPS